MKTHRSIQLFHYRSGGERGVKSVFVQHWKWRQAKKSREVWFVSWWLRMLEHAIKSEHPVMQPAGIILLHDNARLHTDNLVRYTLQRFGWETLQHPPFSPDLSSCDFDIFGDLKKDIR